METPDQARRAAWGRWLRARREARGLTLDDVAEACGVTRSGASRWEGGMVPGLDKADALCEVLGVSERQLVRAAAGLAVADS